MGALGATCWHLAKILHLPHLIFNKPYGVLCQFTDPLCLSRPTLRDYIPIPGVYPAGRLDHDSEGLVLLTDDGRLQHRLTAPRLGHRKTYLAQVERIPEPEALEQLRRGVQIQGRQTLPAQVRLLDVEPVLWPRHPPIRYRKSVPTAWLEIVLQEGRNRQVRRMTAAVGHPTLRLVRTAIGSVRLGALPPGAFRFLTQAELQELLRDPR
jgi:23S rRNA pseudouridine2457 synthase